MLENEGEDVGVDEGLEDEDEYLDDSDSEDTDDKDWKAEALKAKGIAKRYKTKFEKSKIAKVVEKKVEKKLEENNEKGLDRFDRLLLRQEGVKGEAELKLVEDIKAETGKAVEDILESKYFKTELQSIRESAETADATPTGSKRSGQTARDEVDYWIAKGELPKDNPELVRKVVNAKIARERSKNMFSDTSIIS